MKFKDVMTMHQMTSSPKLLLHTWDWFLISASFWKVLETQWTLLLNFLFFIILLHSSDLILTPKILYNQFFWSLKSYLSHQQLICINITLCFLQYLWGHMSEAFEIFVRSITSCLFSIILFLKTSKTCELKEFLLIVKYVCFIIIYLFKWFSNLSLNAIPSLFFLLQGEVHSKKRLLLFTCCYFFLN